MGSQWAQTSYHPIDFGRSDGRASEAPVKGDSQAADALHFARPLGSFASLRTQQTQATYPNPNMEPNKRRLSPPKWDLPPDTSIMTVSAPEATSQLVNFDPAQESALGLSQPPSPTSDRQQSLEGHAFMSAASENGARLDHHAQSFPQVPPTASYRSPSNPATSPSNVADSVSNRPRGSQGLSNPSFRGLPHTPRELAIGADDRTFDEKPTEAPAKPHQVPINEQLGGSLGWVKNALSPLLR